MTPSEGSDRVQFVCVRAEHYRRTAPSCICDLAGWRGYCPAGDLGGHEWMSASTDLARLVSLGYACPVPLAGVRADAAQRDEEDVPAPA